MTPLMRVYVFAFLCLLAGGFWWNSGVSLAWIPFSLASMAMAYAGGWQARRSCPPESEYVEWQGGPAGGTKGPPNVLRTLGTPESPPRVGPESYRETVTEGMEWGLLRPESGDEAKDLPLATEGNLFRMSLDDCPLCGKKGKLEAPWSCDGCTNRYARFPFAHMHLVCKHCKGESLCNFAQMSSR